MGVTLAATGALVLFGVAFLGYPMVAVAGRLRRGRTPCMGITSARWLAGSGLAAVLGFLVYFVLANSEAPLGPVIAGRALPWLVLQVLAVTVVATAITTTIARRRTRTTVTATSRFRLGLLLAGTLAFIPWAAYGGLLLP